MVQNMQRMEFFQYLFPFLLSFAILYGLMQYVFGKEKLGGPRVHSLIAIVLSFFVMLYSSFNPWLYMFLTTTSGVWLGFATVVLLIVLVLALAGVNVHELFTGSKNWVKYVVVLIIIYIVLLAILGQGGLFSTYLPYWLTGSDLWTVVFVIIIIAIVFWFVGEGKEEEGKPAPGGEGAGHGRTGEK